MKDLFGHWHGIHWDIYCVLELMTIHGIKVSFDLLIFCLHSKFWCRNRPGEELKDKYNSYHNPFFIGDELG